MNWLGRLFWCQTRLLWVRFTFSPDTDTHAAWQDTAPREFKHSPAELNIPRPRYFLFLAGVSHQEAGVFWNRREGMRRVQCGFYIWPEFHLTGDDLCANHDIQRDILTSVVGGWRGEEGHRWRQGRGTSLLTGKPCHVITGRQEESGRTWRETLPWRLWESPTHPFSSWQITPQITSDHFASLLPALLALDSWVPRTSHSFPVSHPSHNAGYSILGRITYLSTHENIRWSIKF